MVWIQTPFATNIMIQAQGKERIRMKHTAGILLLGNDTVGRVTVFQEAVIVCLHQISSQWRHLTLTKIGGMTIPDSNLSKRGNKIHATRKEPFFTGRYPVHSMRDARQDTQRIDDDPTFTAAKCE